MKGSTRVTIMAEAAQGYEGDPSLALRIVRTAAEGRADLVKFQLIYADEIATKEYPYYRLFKKLEMPISAWRSVAEETRRAGLGLVFDVYGPESMRDALEMQADALKIHTTDFFNDALFDRAVELAPHVFFSAGGIEVDEIEARLRRHAGALSKLTLMYGFQSEPTPTADNNLRRVARLRERFPGVRLGFMDHADGDSDEASWLGILSLPFGVTVIEKHITPDRSLKLEDYISALDAPAFARYVGRIRAAETALGNENLDLTEAERAYRRKGVKKVTARKDLETGHRIQPDDIILLRNPKIEDGGNGHTPVEQAQRVVGRQTRHAVRQGRPIYPEDLA